MDALFVDLIAVASGPPEGISLSSLLQEATLVVKGVLVLLVLMSLATWYVILYKALILRRAKRESRKFLDIFWRSKRLDEIFEASERLTYSPVSQVFRTAYIELTKQKGAGAEGDTMHDRMGDLESIERALHRAATAESVNLSSMTSLLATTASAAPFVGLFGTVWGIMDSFINIAREQNATLLTVAPGIAEALIATAIGLVAAIPAVMAYNFFSTRIHVLEAEMDNFANDFLNIVKRHFFK